MVLAQDLRDAVLQAALQGKLTEQLDSDSSVEELLVKIKKSKIDISRRTWLIEEDDELFEIPKTWRWVRLETIADIKGGKRVPVGKSLVDNNTGHKYIRVADMQNGTINIDSIKYITDDVYELIKKYYIKKEDIYITVAGTIGRVGIVPPELDGANLTENADKIIFSHLNKQWFLITLSSNTLQTQIRNFTKKVGQPKLALKRIKELLIPLPPIEEQQRIVDRVNEVVVKIDEYEKVENELFALEQRFPDDMKNALLQAAMQGKLTKQLDSDSSVDEMLDAIKEEKKQLIKEKKIKKEKALPPIEEDEIPFDIPDYWRWIRWGDLAYSIQYGYNAPAKENGKIKMVRISDIQDNKVVWETVPYCEIADGDIETYLLKENDILFARTGGTVGKSFLVKEVKEKAIYAGYLIRTRYNNKLVAQYLKYFMESQLYWVQLQNGKTKGCQPNCNGQTLSKMIIPLPPIEEQQRIVERLEQLLPLCETL